jgi:hypothetical protein
MMSLLMLGTPFQRDTPDTEHGTVLGPQSSKSATAAGNSAATAGIPVVPEDSDLYRLLHTPSDRRRGRADAGPRDHSP